MFCGTEVLVFPSAARRAKFDDEGTLMSTDMYSRSAASGTVRMIYFFYFNSWVCKVGINIAHILLLFFSPSFSAFLFTFFYHVHSPFTTFLFTFSAFTFSPFSTFFFSTFLFHLPFPFLLLTSLQVSCSTALYPRSPVLFSCGCAAAMQLGPDQFCLAASLHKCLSFVGDSIFSIYLL